MVKGLQSINWFEKIIEILVVVIGISLAFVLDRSYENYKNNRMAQLYLTGLKEDLNADLVQLDSIQVMLKNQQKQLKHFLDHLPARKIKRDSLAIYLNALSNLQLFEMRASSFRSLQSSGQVALIPDFRIRQQLFSYYHKSEELKIFQQVLQEYFNRFIVPVLIEKLDMSNGKILDRNYFNSVPFKNIVLGYWSLQKQQQQLYQTIQKKAVQLSEQIEQQLKR